MKETFDVWHQVINVWQIEADMIWNEGYVVNPFLLFNFMN
jgi:hypothetical protein